MGMNLNSQIKTHTLCVIIWSLSLQNILEIDMHTITGDVGSATGDTSPTLAQLLQEKINRKPIPQPITPELDRLLNIRAGDLTPFELALVYDFKLKQMGL